MDQLLTYKRMSTLLFLELMRLFSKAQCFFLDNQLEMGGPRPFHETFCTLLSLLCTHTDFAQLASIVNTNQQFYE